MLSQHASASYAQQMGLHAEAGKVNQSNAHKDSSAQSEKLTVIFPCICSKKNGAESQDGVFGADESGLK